MYNKKFLEDLAERAIKTFAQTFLALVGSDMAGIFTIATVDTLKVSLGAAVLSVLSSIASTQVGDSTSASATKN
jgi:hypothetical protein